ncbi:MAG: sigma-70 family RNA polymerase sigma factor, partial [Acidimicrobiia bacterium]|nr:sigma-70 family RNA polymerase sigma factor [Acidimicrobiia bacterium]
MAMDADGLARNLFQSHGAALEGWANSRFGDPQLASEVVQETVLLAWRKYDQYDPSRGSERAWMFGIARNVAASHHRRRERYLRVVPTEQVSETGQLDPALSRLAEISFIVDGLQALSPNHRAVVAAAYWEGLTTREIAQRLGIP